MGFVCLTASIMMASIIVMMNHYYDELGKARSTKCIKKKYDFIVVGGGTSGSVVAARLSEDPRVRVLLLEAGGSGSELTDIPLFQPIVLRSKMTHNYPTVPQKRACGETGICQHAVAIVLGGGSTHNHMGFFRGNRYDYDDWAEKEGARGWSYDEVLPYLKKLETAKPGLGSDQYRGRDGPVYVKQNIGEKYLFHEFSEKWLQAAKKLDYPIGDYNGQLQTVFAPMQVTIDRNGRRASSDNAYIKPIEKQRNNLDILLFAQVNRILFEGKTAIGVEYVHQNSTKQVFATKEIILSAGALNTPKLLMLSGVGPRDQLTKHNIKPVVYVEGVGRNFQDHPGIRIDYKFNEKFKSKPILKPENFLNFKYPAKSFGSSSNIGIGICNTSYSRDQSDSQIRMWFNLLTDKNDAIIGFSLFNSIWKPTSVGRIWLNSSNPMDLPIIDPNYLDTQQDRDNLVDVVLMAKKMMETSPFKSMGVKPFEPIIRRCKKYGLWTEHYLRCSSESEAATELHYCCTAKMGKSSDPLAVLDERLRVRGVEGLRVIDASVMPSIPRANTNGPCLMIGEKGADLIKQDWKLK